MMASWTGIPSLVDSRDQQNAAQNGNSEKGDDADRRRYAEIGSGNDQG
jgi:hypothetical protein